MTRIAAFKIGQSPLSGEATGVTLYVATMTLAELRKHADIDMWTPDNPEGYQRPLEPRRLRDISRYVREQEGVLPTSVLCGTRPSDSPHPTLIGFDGEAGGSSSGWMDFPEGSKLRLIDGQHRYSGVNMAYELTQDERLADYAFPLVIMWDVDRYTEMLHFNIINTRQKKMSTDIVDRHLVQIQEKRGVLMVAPGAKGAKDYMRATATRLVDELNEVPGPWFHRIQVPGVPGRDEGLVRQHAFVTSLDPYLKDSWVQGRTDDDKVRVLANFWAAAEQAWPEAFEEPANYRVQATVGIYSLHAALPVVIQRCLDAKDLTQASMAKVLVESGIDSTFWSKIDGHDLTLGTGMSSIRALTQHIIQCLPAKTAAPIKM